METDFCILCGAELDEEEKLVTFCTNCEAKMLIELYNEDHGALPAEGAAN